MTARRGDFPICPAPDRRAELHLFEMYSPQEMASIKAGLVPQGSDDRWFLYFEDDTLNCRRSWTGAHILSLRFALNADGGGTLVGGWASRDAAVYGNTDPQSDADLAFGIIDRLLLPARS